jgi:hypothetical protein
MSTLVIYHRNLALPSQNATSCHGSRVCLIGKLICNHNLFSVVVGLSEIEGILVYGNSVGATQCNCLQICTDDKLQAGWCCRAGLLAQKYEESLQ